MRFCNAGEEPAAMCAGGVAEVVAPPVAGLEKARLVLSPGQRFAEGVVGVEAHELAQVDVRDAGVAAHELEGLADQRGERAPDVEAGCHRGKRTGFVFEEPSVEALAGAIRRAIDLLRDPRAWRTLQRRAARKDFSWEKSAKAYAAVYRRTVRASRARGV